jgi:blue light- and temperature-responsive anti-repressor
VSPADDFGYSFAFQPIVNITDRGVFAYEALARGLNGESAATVLNAFKGEALDRFDRDARCRALKLAAALGLATSLSLNLRSGSLESLPDAISSTIEAAQGAQIDLERVILEVTEAEIIHDTVTFAGRMNAFRARGIRLAIDDFGAGYSGLNLLADFQPDLIKLDMQLIRAIDSSGPRQAIVRAVLQVCRDLGIDVIAEGVETLEEFRWLQRRGIELFQGYLFGRPGFEALATPVFP